MSERDPIIEAAAFVAERANVGIGNHDGQPGRRGWDWGDLMYDQDRPDMRAVRHAAGDRAAGANDRG